MPYSTHNPSIIRGFLDFQEEKNRLDWDTLLKELTSNRSVKTVYAMVEILFCIGHKTLSEL